MSWWDGSSFHDNLWGSDGLKPQERRYVDIADVPDKVKLMYEKVLPHYQYLYARRL